MSEFDPNQPYEAVDSGEQQEGQKQQTFDPNQPYEPVDEQQSQVEASPESEGPGTLDELKSGAQGVLNHAKAGIEGFERGATFGGADWLRQHVDPFLTGEDPDKIKQGLVANEQNYPISSEVGKVAGNIAGLAGTEGLGESMFGVKTAIAGLPKWSRLTANIFKGALEGGMIQGGDEASKSLLDQNDPEASVGSALTNMGVAGLIGGGVSGVLGLGGIALKTAADSALGNRLGKFMSDFGNQVHIEKAVPDKVKKVWEELHNFHESTANVGDEARGASGLKSQAIDKLSQNVTPAQIDQHINEVSDIIDKANPELTKDKLFQPVIDKWKAAVMPADGSQATPGAIFKATEQLKKQMQEWGQYNKAMVPLNEQAFRNEAKSVGHGLRESLEDPKVWGDLGKLQSSYNKATSEYFAPLKDFNGQFTRKIEGDPTVDIGKVSTYIKQVGKDSGEFKNGVLNRYIDAADKYRSQLDNMHSQLGLASPFEEAPMTMTRNAMGEQTPGAKLATELYGPGVSKIVSKIAAAGAGYAAGGGGGAEGFMGGALAQPFAKYLEPMVENTVGKSLKQYAIPALVKTMGVNAPGAAGQVLDYATKVGKGSQLIKGSLDKLMKASAIDAYSDSASDSDKKKLHKFIEDGGMNSQMQNTLNKMNTKPAPTPQSYAEGGEIPQNDLNDTDPSTTGLSSVYPAHAQMLETAKGRVYNYLNQLRPQQNPAKLPFDKAPVDEMAKKKYDRALGAAIHPLGILNKVKDGSINIEDMTHMAGMYPELHGYLAKQMTKKVTEAQQKGIVPPYKTRQGMSMFLSAPMDSTFTPANIQSIQAVFTPNAMPATQGGAKGKTRKGTSTLGKSNSSYNTAEQDAESDRSQRD